VLPVLLQTLPRPLTVTAAAASASSEALLPLLLGGCGVLRAVTGWWRGVKKSSWRGVISSSRPKLTPPGGEDLGELNIICGKHRGQTGVILKAATHTNACARERCRLL